MTSTKRCHLCTYQNFKIIINDIDVDTSEMDDGVESNFTKTEREVNHFRFSHIVGIARHCTALNHMFACGASMPAKTVGRQAPCSIITGRAAF